MDIMVQVAPVKKVTCLKSFWKNVFFLPRNENVIAIWIFIVVIGMLL